MYSFSNWIVLFFWDSVFLSWCGNNLSSRKQWRSLTWFLACICTRQDTKLAILCWIRQFYLLKILLNYKILKSEDHRVVLCQLSFVSTFFSILGQFFFLLSTDILWKSNTSMPCLNLITFFFFLVYRVTSILFHRNHNLERKVFPSEDCVSLLFCICYCD